MSTLDARGGLLDLEYPSFIKYMGSKSKIMDFVLQGINEVYDGGVVCDLFAGSASLSGAIGQQCAVHSNDIQAYSATLSRTYSQSYLQKTTPSASSIIEDAQRIVDKNRDKFGEVLMLSKVGTITEFDRVEKLQRSLINKEFDRGWHLFAKNYSGTWWSYEQCLWIDALREVADAYKRKASYPAILSSLMFAMAYTSQGTGHYAQYRDPKTDSSLSDIMIYRKRSVVDYFRRKYDEVLQWLPSHKPVLPHKSTSLDFRACLAEVAGGTVYADPPYCFVHYSRFYHAIETLVLYDYPELQVKNGAVVKGRYRENRHQSPFCIKSQVVDAFRELFEGVQSGRSNLVLSYSNTGMISIDEIEKLAFGVFKGRKIELLSTDHQHMTLGRKQDRHREVKECLILVR